MLPTINYNLENLLQFLTKLQSKNNQNPKLQLYDYRMEQFVDIDLIEYDEHSGTILIK
jgi:hypothetical protein